MRRRTPRAVAHRPRKPWLEALEERGSPSVLPFHGLPDLAPERPAPAAGDVRAGESWGLIPARGDEGAVTRTDGEAENGPLTPAGEPALIGFTDVQAGEWLQDLLQGGPSITSTRGPAIVLYAEEGEDGLWTFSGHVETDSPGGLLVLFGGLPTLVGKSTEVNEDGTFSFTIQLADCEGGVATAQAEDWEGILSDVAEDVVLRTGCPQ